MLIATRVLYVRSKAGNIEVPVRIFAPVERTGEWACRIEVGWPDGTVTMEAAGFDAVQALHVALQLVGAQLYASDHHLAGNLVWQQPGRGYGFPVTNNLRDLLVGDDKRFL